MRRLMLSYFVIFLFNVVVQSSDRRVKRVIDGEVVVREMNAPYDALRYFVVIGNGHNCEIDVPGFPFWKKSWSINIAYLGRVCRPEPANLKCTGSLLTPFIVQTACHCVVNFIVRPNGTELSVTKNVFENRYDIFPGKLKVEDIPGGVMPKKYLSHPKCYMDSNWKTLLYDYGLIVLKTSFDQYQTVYAPVYPENDLVRLYTELQAKRKICLTIGFGTFKTDDRAQSPVLRHGWYRAMDYTSCYKSSFNYGDAFNYTNDASWFCILPIQNFGVSGFGDSGGPITCDNHYAGFVSQSFTKRGQDIDSPMSTAFSLFENAFEYRTVLLERLSKEVDDVEYPVAPYRPSIQPIVNFVELHNAKNVQPRTTSRAIYIMTIVISWIL